MTREDIQDLLAMMQAAYPNYNPQSKTAAINAWLMSLEEYDRNTVFIAFKAFMITNASGFAPTPGQIIEQIQRIKNASELNENEAWALVSMALRNSGYHSVEEFEKLPEIVQKAVGSSMQLMIWATDENYNEGVVSSNFIKCYRAEIERSKQVDKLPRKIKELIESGKKENNKIEQKNNDLTKKEEKVIRGVAMPEHIKEKFIKMMDY